MYLRVTKRRNRDGSVIEYYQLAETRWDPEKRRPAAHIVHNFGRADALDREALWGVKRRQGRRALHELALFTMVANRRRDKVPELQEASGVVDALRITLRLSARLGLVSE